MENLKNANIEDIMEILAQICHDYEKLGNELDYIKIAEYTTRLLKEVFKEGYSLPIDIYEIVRYFGIEIKEIHLNEEEENIEKANRIVGQLSVHPNIFGENKVVCICIDSDTTLYTQRYALAHELGHFLINEKRHVFTDNYCIMPMLPIQAEELVSDVFAISLLIPIETFYKQFQTYLEEEKDNGKLPICTEEWLQYLSTSARVSYHYVACGYQQLRCIAFWMYRYHSYCLKLKEDLEEKKKQKIENWLTRAKREYSILSKIAKEELTNSVTSMLFQ